jgi:hypothetical protein
MGPRITETDLMDALRAAMDNRGPGEDGFTGAELARKLGIAGGRACRLVRELLESGKAERVRIYREGIDGRRLGLTGYRLVAKSPVKPKR